MSSTDEEAGELRRFGEKLRTLRVRRSLTLQQLAGALGLAAHGYLSELERGKKAPTVALVLRVARLFDVTTDQLLKDELDVVSGDDRSEGQ